MNIFVLPSWYPSPANPVAGIFIKEQVEAVSALSPHVCLSISTWGHASGHLSLRSPRKTLAAFRWRLRTPGERHIHHANGLHEFFSPALSWSHELPFGGIRCLLEVNRRNLIAAIQKHGVIDLIHAHVGYPGGVLAMTLSKMFQIPYILTEHMGPFRMASLLRAGKPIPELQSAFRNAAVVIAVSSSLAESIRELGLSDPVVIPNVVNETLFYPGEPNPEKFVFFSLCILTHGKGIDDLLHAIHHWNPPAKNFEFWIAGDGPMASSYKSLAEQLGISDRVKWIGAVSRHEAAALFRQCKSFILPSRYETFGVVYAEAIASGKPVIATRCGGPESIVTDINGILVEIGDHVKLSKAMQMMAEKWSSYNHNAIRMDFMGRFSRHAVVKKLVDLYQVIVE